MTDFRSRKSPWRLSPTRKAGHRARLKAVDSVIAAVAESGVQTRSLEVAKALPKEHEMSPKGNLTQPPRLFVTEIPDQDMGTVLWAGEVDDADRPLDKYTVFSKKHKGYRKGIHKVPKWTRVGRRCVTM